jgi:phospholipase A2
MAPGSLADEIWKESQDASLNPEIERGATVRIGDGLCQEEEEFRRRRKQAIVKDLAAYLGVREADIHPDDVPVIAMCGSGGGLRALIAGTGSYLATKEAGLWDCVMYTAGVSGSCWLQTLYNSSLGGQDYQRILDHLKKRLAVHFAFPPHALEALTRSPTNKYLLRGIVEKLKGDPGADFGLVDIYGLLLASRLLVFPEELRVNDSDLKLSNQRAFVDSGANPLPIYSAVRHEIPVETSPTSETVEELKERAKRESWFQWFEFTPYEFFCEELSAGIPIWALGRHFKDGRDMTPTDRPALPELRIPALMGLWGSAFCATLAHYYKEIKPALTGLAGFGGIDSLISGKNEDLSRVHPIDPAAVPNFVLGLKDRLPSSCPESIFEHSHLRLMDAGMSNNLPIYPLLRSGRDVDLVIAFDASADIKEANWLSAVDGYATQRGIKGWPIGSGWPKGTSSEEAAAILEQPPGKQHSLQTGEASTTNGGDGGSPGTNEENTQLDERTAPQKQVEHASELGYCSIWLGSAAERTSSTEPPPTKRLFHPSPESHDEADVHLTRPDAGIAVVYFPLLPNPAAPPLGASVQPQDSSPPTNASSEGQVETKQPLPIVDPVNHDYTSTWKFVYTADQVDALASLARTNFMEGEKQVKRVVRGIYERKRRARLERERAHAHEESNPFC